MFGCISQALPWIESLRSGLTLRDTLIPPSQSQRLAVSSDVRAGRRASVAAVTVTASLILAVMIASLGCGDGSDDSGNPSVLFSNHHQVYLLSSDGSRRHVTSGEKPRWSPNHRQLILSRTDYEATPGPTQNLWIADVDGAGLRRLTSAIPPNQVRFAAFGGRPAYVVYADSFGIWKTTTSGASPTRVLADEWANDLTISPDGSAIAYARNQTADEPAMLNRLDVRTQTNRPIFTGRVHTCGIESPDWSPDAQWLVFVICADKGNQNEVLSIWLVRPDGQDLQQIAERGESPTWSPDGKWIAFIDKKVNSDRTVLLSALVRIRPNGTERSLATPYVPATEAAALEEPDW